METVAFELTEGLSQQQDVEIDVLCANVSRLTVNELFPSNYSVHRSASWGAAFSTSLAPRLVFDLAKSIDNYDIVHIHLPNPLANLALWLIRPKCKVVLHWHSDIIKQKYLLKIYAPLQHWLLKRADAIIATSPPYIDTSPCLSAHREKVTVIPIGTNSENTLTNTHLLQSLRATYAGKRVVFSLGRLTYYKGFLSLIRAATSMPDDIVILIGGQGELLADLQYEINALDLSGRVRLLGEIPPIELGAYYDLADVFCLPSIARSEAFGVVLLEAMAHAKPIVATQIPGSGVPWVTVDGITGINVEPNNPDALAHALMKILSDKKLADDLAQQSQLRYQQMFTARKMVQKTMELYSSLLTCLQDKP